VNVAGVSALKRQGKERKRPLTADAAERRQIEAAQRDPACFAELYEANFERVYAFILRRVGDRDQAEDLTADVFHKALESLGRFEWRSVPFIVWLFRIAANAIADRGRGVKRLEKLKRSITQLEHSATEDLEEADYRARLFKLVDDLPDDQRRVVTMRFAKEQSTAEIAKAIGRSEGAVKQLQFRGLQALRSMVGQR